MVIWGSSYLAMKIALQAYHPLLIVFGRMSIAAALFLIFYKKFTPFPYHKGDWKYILLMALCEPCCYFLFESYALKYTTSSQAGMVAALLPVMVAVVAGVVLQEKTTPATFAGFGVALVGLWLMTTQSVATSDAPHPLLGNFLELVAMGFASGYTVLSRYLGARYSALFLTASQMSIGALFFFPALFFTLPQTPFALPLYPSLAILYLGVGVSVGAYSLYNHGLRKISASQASAFVNLVPVFAVLFGWIGLGEKLALIQSVGIVLVFAGVWLSSLDLKWQKVESLATK
jgi:drug/metabolite transporter (DMT)-like permease